MWALSTARRRLAQSLKHTHHARSQGLTTLAIESSCDDTSVAVLDRSSQQTRILFHEKITSNNLEYKGVHPLVSLDSHQQNLALLVQKATRMIEKPDGRPDFVTVTRGPGMRSNVSTGLDTAKGLAVAWDVPLVAVNHMQAHALTPRLVSSLNQSTTSATEGAPPNQNIVNLEPQFPFISLLISGGHTLLLESKTLCDHRILAETADIAIGDAIDKIARYVLPDHIIESAKSTMYGPLLESFAFPDAPSYNYKAPATRQEELERRITRWGWGLIPPLSASKAGTKSKSMEYSFTGTVSSVSRLSSERALHTEERQEMAREAMRVLFEHLASRIVLALKAMQMTPQTLVVSGGVAANRYLRHLLREFLDVRGFSHVRTVFPPLELCTDNAAMIGWAGLEMYEAGWTSDLSCQALRRWSLDPDAADGGILGVPGWRQRLSK